MVTPDPNRSVGHDAKDLIGTWTLVSVVTERDGKKSDAYGPNAKGSLVFDANGRYSIIFIAADLPKFVSGIRSTGTADENKAVVAGSLAHFGTYVVDEADKSFTFQRAHNGYQLLVLSQLEQLPLSPVTFVPSWRRCGNSVMLMARTSFSIGDLRRVTIA